MSPEIDPEQAKRRKRWRRNKKAERARKASPAPMPQPLSAELIAEVWAERERRCVRGAAYMWPVPGWREGRGSWEFQCDVWAVKTLLEIQLRPRRPTHGMIASWMAENDFAHSYSHGKKSSSLRTMVGRALTAIAILETAKLSQWAEPAWPRFSPTNHPAVMQENTDA